MAEQKDLGNMPGIAVWFCIRSSSRLDCLSTSMTHFSLNHYIPAPPDAFGFTRIVIKIGTHHDVSGFQPLLSISTQLRQPLPKEAFPSLSLPHPVPVICPSSMSQYHLSIFFVEFSMILKLHSCISIAPHQIRLEVPQKQIHDQFCLCISRDQHKQLLDTAKQAVGQFALQTH